MSARKSIARCSALTVVRTADKEKRPVPTGLHPTLGEGPRVDGESGGGARSLDPQWVRDIIADCRSRGVVPFPKQWGTHSNNPLVVEQGMSIAEAKALDKFGKGRGLVDGKPVREHPCGCNSARTRCS